MNSETPNKFVDSLDDMDNGATVSVDDLGDSANAALNGKGCKSHAESTVATIVPNLCKIVGAKSTNPVEWGVPADILESDEFRDLRRIYQAFRANKKKSWLRCIAPAVQDESIRFLAALQTAYACRQYTAAEFEKWSQFCQDLPPNQDSDRGMWREQILRVELPLIRAILSPDSSPPADEIVAEFSRSIERLLDSDGWPHARLLPELEWLIASWTRSYHIIEYLDEQLEDDIAEQLEWLVRQVIRMWRPDRTLMLKQDRCASMEDEYLKSFLRLSGDKLDRQLAKRRAPGEQVRKSSRLTPEASDLSEWAELGVMQSAWDNGRPKVAVSILNRSHHVEIANHATLINGDTTPSISLNGKLLRFEQDFDVVCWHTDDDVDYLELEGQLENQVVWQRQLLLAREDAFLFWSDVIVPPDPGRIDYLCEFPLANKIGVLPESETSELYLKDGGIRALVLPLCLSEWQSNSTAGTLSFDDSKLRLSQSISGHGLCCSLFIDLDEKRSQMPRTWRQLTVGESLNIVSPDQAVAFRIQIGSEQWVVYRAVASGGNRTFMGENFSDDFFIGRFDQFGDVDELLQISR